MNLGTKHVLTQGIIWGAGVQENQIGKKMHTLQNESKTKPNQTKKTLDGGREYEDMWTEGVGRDNY